MFNSQGVIICLFCSETCRKYLLDRSSQLTFPFQKPLECWNKSHKRKCQRCENNKPIFAEHYWQEYKLSFQVYKEVSMSITLTNKVIAIINYLYLLSSGK